MTSTCFVLYILEYMTVGENADFGTERKRMAQRVQVVLEDDLDGGKADETVSFALDGTSYEIDLSKKNAAKLRDALAQYVGAGRRVSGRRSGGGRARGGRGRSGSDSADIRAWAKDNGYEVSERGRISAEIRAAYNEAK